MSNPLTFEIPDRQEYLEYYRSMIDAIESIEESERLIFADIRDCVFGSQLFKALVDYEREQAEMLRADESSKALAELHLRLSEKLFVDVNDDDTLVYREIYVKGKEQPSLEILSQMLGITSDELRKRRDRAIEAIAYITGLLAFWNMPAKSE